MRILLIDDDPDTRRLAKRAIVQELPAGVVEEAADEAGLERVLGSGNLDLVVSDYDIRWIDGFDVLRRVREASPACAAVMFTGTGNEDLAVRAIKAGFDDYIVKAPGQFRRLATSARVALERSQERGLLRENRELLRKELYHRLHNNLQLVLSLMQLTTRAIADEGDRQEMQELMRRIQSLSTLQEQLYQAEDLRKIDLGVFTRDLLEQVAGDFPGKIGSTDIEQVIVSVDRAVPLALIFGEMIMNRLDTVSEEKPITVSLRDGSPNAEFVVGGGVDAPNRSALSSHLVARLASQIDASVAGGQSAGMVTRVAFTA